MELKDAFASGIFNWGPITALVVFFVFMLLVLAWLYRPNARQTYAILSRQALDQEPSREGDT